MLTKEDLLKHEQFKTVLNKGDFNLKGEAVVRAASLFYWFNELGKKMQESIKDGEDLRSKLRAANEPKKTKAKKNKRAKDADK